MCARAKWGIIETRPFVAGKKVVYLHAVLSEKGLRGEIESLVATGTRPNRSCGL